MLFNTFNFVFLFLPVSFLCSRIFKSSKSENIYISLLIIISFYFYSYFITSYIFILIFSIFINYFFGNLLIQIKGYKLRKSLFLFMISINLILLIYFKYFNFLVENLRGIEWQTCDRSVDVLVSRLRNKLGESPSKTRFIITVHGIGYRFVGAVKNNK